MASTSRESYIADESDQIEQAEELDDGFDSYDISDEEFIPETPKTKEPVKVEYEALSCFDYRTSGECNFFLK